MFSDAKEKVPPTGSSGKNGRQVKKRLKGALAAFVDMPLDIMLCVHGYPLDLLHLTHLLKAFQHVLTSKFSVSAWKSVKRNIGGLPEPFHGLSEPAWANLVFILICHFCYKTSAKMPELLFRGCICTACMPLHMLSIVDLQRVPESVRTDDGTLLVATRIPISLLSRALEIVVLKNLVWYKTMKRYARLGSPVIPNMSATRSYNQDQVLWQICDQWRASECSSWLSRMQVVKDMKVQKLKRNRLQAIQLKLACLGYGAELAMMPSVDIIAKHSLVNQTQPLTDRIWTNIQEELVKYVEKVKVNRLAR
ncbi:hypothetical protein ARMGADRAFT_1077705 [Armillaria gallica]|uniref:F-box domain-containing protein n=1 Tax=Armillaria gallica TaxID=47427 RepID=A0A2H3DQ65_ARMGA|nr:hypothetical protein ARMGADRAFT_1077705 [Armillaria gallica]